MSWEPLLRSFEVATIATCIAGIVGVGLAGWMARSRFVGSDLVDALITAPLVLPPTVLGYYLLLGIGRRSLLGRAYESVVGSPLVFTKTAAIVAASFAAFPLIVRSSRAAMEDVDKALTAAAATLGAPPREVFLSIVLPLSRNGVAAGVTLGFARALGEFGVTLMIAGNIPGVTQTASLAIYDAVQANREADATGMAAVMTACAIAAVYGGTKLVRRKHYGF